MSSDKGTDTHTDHYDADGNYVGHSDSHTEPSNELEDVLNDTVDAVTGSSDSDKKD